MSPDFPLDLEPGVRLYVVWSLDGPNVVNYSVILTVEHDGQETTARLYDAAHGFNEMHRHTRSGGKQSGEVFHYGTLAEGLNAAYLECRDRYGAIIDAWRTS